MANSTFQNDTNVVGEISNPIPYYNFKTPFFTIKISNANGSQSTELPSQILRLVQKLEIIENWGDACKLPVVINLVFTEGSREPFTTTDTNTNSLYSIDDSSFGTLTNKTGLLADLQFVGDTSFITAFSESSVTAIPTNVNAAGIEQANTTLSTAKYSGKKPSFLFQEGNIITVTWGYLEQQDPQIPTRAISAPILTVQADFPDASQPTFTVTCNDLGAKLAQLSPVSAQIFADKLQVGVDTFSGKPLEIFQDLSTQDIIKKIADFFGWDNLVSTSLLAPKLDSHHAKVWSTGQSLDSFLRGLASRHRAYYSVTINPKTLKPTLVFISRVEFEKRFKLRKDLFSYKTPGTILKSVSIRADFGNISGSANVGVDNDANQVVQQSDTGQESTGLFEGQGYAPAFPDLSNTPSAIDTFINNINLSASTGKANYLPEAEDKTNMLDTSKTKAGCLASKIVSVELNALGYPLLKAGDVIYIGNIGTRYSQFYFTNTVTHTIDSDGYHMSVVGQNHAVMGPDTVQDTATPGKDDSNTEEFQQFQPSNLISPSSGSTDSIIDSFNKLRLGQ